MTAFGQGIDFGWVLFAIVAAAAVVMIMLMRRLRRAHPRAWEAMGKPVAQIWGSDFRGRLGLVRFLFSDAHAALHDSRVTTLVWAMRALIAAFVVVVAVQWMGGEAPRF
jgi:hypothetical protein